MAAPSRTPSPAPLPEPDDSRADPPTPGPRPPDPRPEGEKDRQAVSDPGVLHETVEALEDQLRWITADLENLRKRYDREIRRERLAERGRVAGEWLPVIDNLDLALQHADHTADAASRAVITGVRAVRDQALGVLERLGFSPFDDVGKPFDPSRHEAVGTVAGDAPDNTIVAAVRSGYGNDDDVLRPAAVVVARRSNSAPPPSDVGSGGSDAAGPASRKPS